MSNWNHGVEGRVSQVSWLGSDNILSSFDQDGPYLIMKYQLQRAEKLVKIRTIIGTYPVIHLSQS